MEYTSSASDYRVEQKHWWYVSRRKLVFSFLERFLNKKSGNKILDYGCGTGGNATELLQHFGDVTCVDTSKTALEFCKKRGLKKLYCSDFEETKKIPFKSNSFDLITSFDVLEHTCDDLKILKKLNSLLKKGGLLIVSVPAHMLLWGVHDMERGHKRRYSSADLISKLKKSGFTIIAKNHFFSFVVPLVFIVRAYERINFKICGIKHDVSSTAKIPPHTINSFLKFLSSIGVLISKYGDIPPFGVSFFCVAKKS